jgi:NAD-dependent dihydropyrimidine dehydrogenase PreA subunit
VSLASQNRDGGWQQAVINLAEIRPAEISIHYEKYREIFYPRVGAAVGLYECQHVNGRFPGPATFAVKNLYERVGMIVEGAEMPDHASVELAFLAYLCQQEAKGDADSTEWRRSRRLFIRNHARKWLPEVGRALRNSGALAWETLGQVLIASLDLSKKPQSTRETSGLVPVISDISHCNLCGFCVQACPTQALMIREDQHQTELWMLSEKCVGCQKCEQVCSNRVLTLGATQQKEPVILMSSERAHCPHCGTSTVSRVELEAVAAMLGEHPQWLDLCLSCR